jgi:hypothetical protein
MARQAGAGTRTERIAAKNRLILKSATRPRETEAGGRAA